MSLGALLDVFAFESMSRTQEKRVKRTNKARTRPDAGRDHSLHVWIEIAQNAPADDCILSLRISKMY